MPDDARPGPEFVSDAATREVYRSLVAGERRSGERGRILFCVSTDDVDDGRGDLFVALGLARALSDLGWGVSFWATPKMVEQTPDDIDIAILMVESFVPGLIHPRTKAVAWVRNWTEQWAALPYLEEFSQIWCSSNASAVRMRSAYSGVVNVVELGTDVELFRARDVPRASEMVTTANFWGVDRGLTKLLSEVAEHEPVTWFGTNSRYLQLEGSIDHRDAIDYFALPDVYSRWLVVVDDVIPAAAEYGNQNSRLFDAIAAGAIVATNASTGLVDLGLEESPVYSDADDLRAIVQRLAADPDAATALSDRLREVVLRRHSYAYRAAALLPMLEEIAAERADEHGSRRSRLLRWTTLQREALRSMESERSHWRTAYYDTGEELETVKEELEKAYKELNGIRTSRSYRLAHLITRPLLLFRRR